MLGVLAQAPRTVDQLARASGQSTANTSQHLQALPAGGPVTRVRAGTSVRYARAGDEEYDAGHIAGALDPHCWAGGPSRASCSCVASASSLSQP